MSVHQGVSDGEWSVFAQKVVEERDAALEKLAHENTKLIECEDRLREARAELVAIRCCMQPIIEMYAPMPTLARAVEMMATGSKMVFGSTTKELDTERAKVARLTEACERAVRDFSEHGLYGAVNRVRAALAEVAP